MKEKIKQIITILLGLAIVLVRVIYPTHTTITLKVVVIEGLLELAIGILIVIINFQKLKEALFKKIDLIEFIKNLSITFAVSTLAMLLISNTINTIYNLITGVSIMDIDPAAMVGTAFQSTFFIGVAFTQCITAPITEEIVFRMTYKDLIKNNILYIIISSLMFGFIHTADFFNIAILSYVAFGVALNIIYIKFKDVRILIISHMLYNMMITWSNLMRMIIF